MTIQAFLLLANLIAGGEHVPPMLLAGICDVESARHTRVINYNDGGANSYGLCQLQLRTARSVGFKGKASELLKPTVNMTIAAKLIHKLINRYPHKMDCAIAAYNYGSCRLNLSGQIYNRSYVRKVHAAENALLDEFN